jgi:superfamily II DNA/RNA helicase
VQLQGLVLCPTRELADQVSREIRRLARFIPNVKVLTLCGGVPLAPTPGIARARTAYRGRHARAACSN